MATSGSVDYNRTAQQIITRAMRNMGVLGQEQTPNASEMQDGLESLNLMVKLWQADGINLWKMEEMILWLVEGQTKYTLGTDHAATTWVRTTLSADAALGAGSLTVSSIAGISTLDTIGIVLDDGTLQWDTVNGAPTGSTVTLTGTLDSAATSGNQVWAYTTKAARPLTVESPKRRDLVLQDIPIWRISRQGYFDTPNKTSPGRPVNLYYDPQLTGGEVHLWPAPETVNDTILMTVKMPVEDFDTLPINPDFPQEWLSALSWGLAEEMCLEYEVPMDRHQRIAAKAGSLRAILASWDNEGTSVFFQPDYDA